MGNACCAMEIDFTNSDELSLLRLTKTKLKWDNLMGQVMSCLCGPKRGKMKSI